MLPRELHLALRPWARQPVAAATIVVALGLGIGLTATMYSVVRGIFLRDLPFAGGERLVQIDGSNLPAGIARAPVAPRDYLALQEGQGSFEDLAAWAGVAVTASGHGTPAERLNGAYVSLNLFPLLGVSPALGRTFSADEAARQEPVVLVSDAVWRSRLGGTRDAPGRTLRLNGESRTVVGVMPAGFQFPLSQDVWLPLPPGPESRMGMQLVGKLRRSVSLRQAQAELDGLARGLALVHPDRNRDVGLTARPYVEAYSDPEMRSYLRALLAAVLGVLLVACANSANLLLSRAALRGEEMAVRQALGAGRGRLVRQLLAESLLLAAAGGALGTLLAAWATAMLQGLVQPMLRSFWVDVRLDGAGLGFILALTLLAALLAGLYPALRASRPDLMRVLREPARGRGAPRPGRLGRSLVVVQVGLSCGLLVATGLSLKSVLRLATVDLGYATGDLLVGAVSLPGSAYPEEAGWSRYFERLAARLEATPGVRAFAFATSLPPGTDETVLVELEGAGGGTEGEVPGGMPSVQRVVVSAGYFGLLGAAPLAGRDFSAADDGKAPPVAIVNESFARRYLRQGRQGLRAPDLLGRRVRLGAPGEAGPWTTIVGVVPDLQGETLPERRRGFLPLIDSIAAPPGPAAVYLPAAQAPQRDMVLAVRMAGGPGATTESAAMAAMAAAVRAVVAAIAAVDPELPAPRIRTLAESVAEHTWDYRLFGAVFTVLGAVALGLAAVGLHGVIALTVTARTAELGVRAALGAPPGEALRLALGDGLRQLGAGVALGLALALASSRLLAGLLYRVEPWDPLIFAAVAAVLAATGLAACLGPALRAARVDPLQAMRGS